LGGARSEVPIYKTFGLQKLSNDELVEVAKMHVQEGHKGLKMVVGSAGTVTDASIRNDVARVAAVREAIGPDVDLMIDANRNFSLAQASKLGRMCEPYELTWFEDSVVRGDPRLMARLRSECRIPLAAGSTGTSDLMYLREYLLHDAVDFLQPK
jgi:L-rhamnonate dehydratase